MHDGWRKYPRGRRQSFKPRGSNVPKTKAACKGQVPPFSRQHDTRPALRSRRYKALTCLVLGRAPPHAWNVRCYPAALAIRAERRCSMARSSADDTGTGDFDFSDFAQEFLRRNPPYKDQYARLHLRDTGDKKTSAARRMARSWGLEFPVRSECFGHRQPGDLEKRCERKRRYRGWRRPGPCRYQRHIG